MTTENKLDIGMSWKAFELVLTGLIKSYKDDKSANEINKQIKTICFSADVLLELEKKKVNIEKIIGKEKLKELYLRYEHKIGSKDD